MRPLVQLGCEISFPRLGWKLREAYSSHQLSRTDERQNQKGPPFSGGPLGALTVKSTLVIT